MSLTLIYISRVFASDVCHPRRPSLCAPLTRVAEEERENIYSVSLLSCLRRGP